MDNPIFQVLNTVAPQLSAQDALRVVKEHYGLEGTEAKDVGSERDRNYRITLANKKQYLLKISNSAEDPQETDFQTKALLHIEAVDPAFPVPKVVPTVKGAHSVQIKGPDNQLHLVRLHTYLPGVIVEDLIEKNLTPQLNRNLGSTLAKLAITMQGFFHPKAGRPLLWDLQHTPSLRPLLPHIKDSQQRAQMDKFLQHFQDTITPKLRTLRSQIVQNDFNSANVLVKGDGSPDIVGVIDFGDMAHAPLICDIAIGVTYVLRNTNDPLTQIKQYLEGYCSVNRLQHKEVAVLIDLIRARLVMTLLIAFWRASIHPYNTEYILGDTHFCWPMFTELTRLLSAPTTLPQLFEACGLPNLNQERKDAAKLMERRKQLLGPSYCLFYEKPLYIVKGEGIWLIDNEGKRYIDCYNNVASVGHCHPRVVATLAEQAATLNTHTRYLHEHIVDYSEQLIKTLEGIGNLKVCLFTCTGSESNDLALRMARAYTGNEGFLISENAYHGSTFLTKQITPSIESGNEKGYARFQASEFQEDCVVRLKAPDVYQRARDVAAGKDPRPHQSDSQFFTQNIDESIAKFGQKGKKLAACIIDPCFMSDGILDPPKGYLPELVDRVHKAGGVYIADEVQAGMGRTGTHIWGFQHFGLVPDIVTLGKPVGNGHPLGVVITTPEIATAFAKETQYFNTFGGNPVSCAVGLTTLDVLKSEKLTENALEVGRYLRAELANLRKKHPSIASLRGQGLALGVEIINPETKQPDGIRCQKVVNRLREDGILLSECGSHNSVLKFRPPLVLSKANADQFIRTLDNALSAISSHKL